MPRVSVIIPTKDRPELLRRCLRAVLDQEWPSYFEVIVVNDAGCAIDSVVGTAARIQVVLGPGRGPAAARNVGINVATGDILLFTDDDTIPQAGWIESAIAALDSSPEAVGVVGCVVSPPFDPLYEHSVHGKGLGNFLTCNVAYRKNALRRVGGFDTNFPYPHGEDRDLGYRMQEIGPVLYEARMLVQHPPRPVDLRSIVRRGRLIESEWALHLRHPQTRPPRWSLKWGPFIRQARNWLRLLTQEHVIHGSLKRGLRFALLASGQLLVSLNATLRGPASSPVRRIDDNPSGTRRLRIAWIGAEPQRGSGAAGCAWLIMEGLIHRNCEIDWYASGPQDELSERVAELRGVRLVNYDTGWRYDRIYSNHRSSKLLTGMASRAWGRRQLASLLMQQHRQRPYDVIYQFSTIEVFGLRRYLSQLPPLVIHPGTHIAGELRWLRQERHLVARCEPRWRRLIVVGVLTIRERRQRRDIGLASQVAVISRHFGQHLVTDYGVDPLKITLVPNPIDVNELNPLGQQKSRGPLRIVFVSRLSVRKGVELVVELSQRLTDLAGQVTLELVGTDTLWSDYRPLLADLDQQIGHYHGHMPRSELTEFLRHADLLIQPAKYEPFGLTVGEALALGVPVIASDQVGATEDVSAECCTTTPVGDIDALEAAVRAHLGRLYNGEGPKMSKQARAEALRLFSPEVIAETAFKMLNAVAGRGEV
jgi:glycosyltransferase involved in cell wall biosynthesis/GT2 family glycosyltransferase